MAEAVYILGALTTLSCAVLLMRGYVRGHSRLLLWSSLCFFGLTVSNILVFLDIVIFIKVDLYLWRLASAAIAMMLLMYGLIWESK